MDTALTWLMASCAAGIVFGGAAVPARRRWSVPGLASVAIGMALIAVVSGWLWIGNGSPVSDEDFGRRLLVFSAIGAVTGGSVAVHYIVKRSTLPDPLVEIGAAAVGFVGGAAFGAWLGVMGAVGVA